MLAAADFDTDLGFSNLPFELAMRSALLWSLSLYRSIFTCVELALLAMPAWLYGSVNRPHCTGALLCSIALDKIGVGVMACIAPVPSAMIEDVWRNCR